MPKEATHYISLSNGLTSVRFWLDSDAMERGQVRGVGGWDEQCVDCGQSINEHGKFNVSQTCVVCTSCKLAYDVKEA